ncbi:copper resistance D family protein [Kribbella sp. NPDC058245]|uniref:copper resistance D family protein n=1 Tax=Kribbella sp. NPDC058245 TaxID=3346399 RepID=UPI0036EDD264
MIADGGAIVVGGGLLVAGWLLPASGLRAAQDAAIAAGVWALASVAGLITSAAVILGIPLSHLAEHASIAGDLTQVRALAVTVVLTAVLAVVLSGVRTTRGARIATGLAALALIPPLLTGHQAIERPNFWSITATTSLVIHVFAATAWIGGLLGVLRYARDRIAVERFSTLALGCAIAIGLTGLITAEIHLDGRDGGWGLITQWVTTPYGALVFAKAVAFAVLVFIGYRHRQATLPKLVAGDPAAFRRLAAGELVIMAATVGLAVALSRTP